MSSHWYEISTEKGEDLKRCLWCSGVINGDEPDLVINARAVKGGHVLCFYHFDCAMEAFNGLLESYQIRKALKLSDE